MRPDLVLKFGGTSVGTPRAVALAARHVVRHGAPLVVASAASGVTDLLLQAAAQAVAGADTAATLAAIDGKHAAILDGLGLDVAAEIDPILAEFRRVLQGVAMLGELSARTKDAIVSTGERVGVRLLAAQLRKLGRRAVAFDAWDLGLTTDSHFGRAEPARDHDQRIHEAVTRLDDDVIPVVTGFIARSHDGAITTLGRGGSDFSAALFGAACNVREIQIWTDVPGILRADPRIVENPGIVPAVRFEEAAELAFFGAKVLHPRTIEPARRRGIPVRVLSTFHVDPDRDDCPFLQGTIIDDKAPDEAVRAIALQKKVESLHVHSLRMLEAPGFLSRMFEVLARHHISVDVVATSEVSVSLTFDRADGDLDAAVEEIRTFAHVERDSSRSVVCVVGSGLREDPRVIARLFDALAERGIPVHMISQGASRINLTIVTAPERGAEALRALHDAFFPAS